MAPHSRVTAFRTALLAALGLVPFGACGGSTSTDDTGGTPDAGSGPEDTGGRATTGGRSSGGSPATGGTAIGTGGASTGGRPGKTNAGAGGMATGGTPESTGGLATTGGDGGAGGATRSFECVPPSTLRQSAGSPGIVAPQPTPFVECEGDWRHRPVAHECPSELPRADEIPAGPNGMDACTSDAECDEKAHGWCTGAGQLAQASGNVCRYGCVSDSDCSDGHICECGELVGECVPSDCTTDEDCDGLLCASYIQNPGCNFPAFACQTPEDECITQQDCPAGTACTKKAGAHRVCSEATCVIGRPFLVDGEVRTAEVAPRSDWLAELDGPCLDGLSGAARAELAVAWTRIGLLEHASIAAFARFTLELLSFGAPAELVARSSQAMSDETAHARKAFALASAYAAEPRGPGPLRMTGDLLESELPASVVTAFLEGCIGETVAALEAREAADSASDPVIRAVLSRVADEEGRHALLAYEFVRWALPRCGAALSETLATRLDSELGDAAASRERTAQGPLDAELVRHGILPETRRRELRLEVLTHVVEPCVRTLLGVSGARAGAKRLGAAA